MNHRPEQTRILAVDDDPTSRLMLQGTLESLGYDVTVAESGAEVIVEITPPGSARALEVLAIVRNTSNPDGVGLEFQARDMGGVHRLREVIRRLVEQ